MSDTTNEHKEGGSIERTFTFTYLPDSLLTDERLTLYDVATAQGIAFYVDKHRAAFPGKKKIAKIARISERKVQECIQNLEKYGYLSITRMKDPKNPQKNLANRYVMHDLPQVKEGGGAHGAPGVGHTMPQSGAHGAPEQDPYNYTYSNNNNVAAKEISQEEKEPVKEDDTNTAMEFLTTIGIGDNPTSRENVNKAIGNGIAPDEMGEFFHYLLSLAKEKGKDNPTGWAIDGLKWPDHVQTFRASVKDDAPMKVIQETIFDEPLEDDEQPATPEEAKKYFKEIHKVLSFPDNSTKESEETETAAMPLF